MGGRESNSLRDWYRFSIPVAGGGVVVCIVGVVSFGMVEGLVVIGGGSSTIPANEHAAVSADPPICCTRTAARVVNGDCGPERGSEGSVKTAENVPGVAGSERGPCFPVRSPVEHARGMVGEQSVGSL